MSNPGLSITRIRYNGFNLSQHHIEQRVQPHSELDGRYQHPLDDAKV